MNTDSQHLQQVSEEFQHMVEEFFLVQSRYSAAIKEIQTKLEILDDEFQMRHRRNPIHHMQSRLKTIQSMLEEGADVMSFGVGTKLASAYDQPTLGGVYKLAAVREDDGSYTPKMKLSESAEKMTIPCLKKVWRIYDQDGKAMADLITMADEVVETQHGITLFDPIETWKECTYVNCTARCLSTPIYENGKRVYSSPSLDDIKKFCKAQVNTLWDEVKRFENPHRYYVDLSQKLWDTRSALLKKLSK